MRALGPLMLAGAATLLGCGDTTETSSDARILITVSTRGADPQSDEYLLTLNGARPLSITPNGSAIYDDVPRGYPRRPPRLAGRQLRGERLPDHRSVRVDGSDILEISFSVLCSTPLTGDFRIVVSTGARRWTTTVTSSRWPARLCVPSA
jgi:hypothetical protein